MGSKPSPVAPEDVEDLTLYGRGKICKLLSIGRRTFWGRLSAGEIPPADYKIGKTLFWKACTISAFLNEHRHTGRPTGSPVQRKAAEVATGGAS